MQAVFFSPPRPLWVGRNTTGDARACGEKKPVSLCLLAAGFSASAVLCLGTAVHEPFYLGKPVHDPSSRCSLLRRVSTATETPAASASARRREREYVAPRAVYQVGFVETAEYVDIGTNIHSHTLRTSLCFEALQGLHDYCCPSAAAVLDRAQVEGAVAVLCALLLLFSVSASAAGDEYYSDGYHEPGRIGGLSGSLGTPLPGPQHAARATCNFNPHRKSSRASCLVTVAYASSMRQVLCTVCRVRGSMW